ncbi:MAG: thiol reductant ABC exporter subunit CydC [Rudaea sp.]
MRLVRSLAPFKWLIAAAVLLGSATVASGIGLMATSAFLISAAALHPSIADLQVAIVGVRFFGISRGVFRYLERLISHTVTLKLLAQWRVWFYQGIEPLAPARLIGQRGGDLLARAVSDVETLQDFYVRAIAPPAVAIVVGLGTALWLLSFGLLPAIVLLVGFLLAGPALAAAVIIVARRPAAELAERRGELNAALVDGVQGMADIIAFGQAEQMRLDISSRSEAAARAQRRLVRINASQSAIGGLVAQLTMITVLGSAAWLITRGEFSPVYLAAIALASVAAFEAVSPLPQAAQSLVSARAASRRLYELVDTTAPVRDPDVVVSPPSSFDLEVRDLCFRYDPESLLTIDGVSFSIAAGEHVAIVGPSGAGKTTLVNLLVRFWDYHQGEILLGGTPLQTYQQATVRETIGVISQTTYLFNASIRDNLAIAREGCTEEEIREAARRAQIDKFIQALPEGYRTEVGERGLRLSGGERQRLAVARAILRETPILVLDEPTANLDAITEGALLDEVQDLFRDRTMLLVTHRLVGLERMDRIIVLDHGRLVDEGTHRQLIDRAGVYSRLWQLQNRALLTL